LNSDGSLCRKNSTVIHHLKHKGRNITVKTQRAMVNQKGQNGNGNRKQPKIQECEFEIRGASVQPAPARRRQ
jgi:hypothetical protein